VLSRKRASEGLYPAIDLLQSSSKMATPGIVGDRHYRIAQEIRRTLAQYQDLKDIIAMLGMEQLSPEDGKAVARARRLERFLTQPFFTTEQFSGIKGRTVSLKDSLDGCERILRDEFKDYPESALYMIGAISEAKKPAPEKKAAPAPAPSAAADAPKQGTEKKGPVTAESAKAAPAPSGSAKEVPSKAMPDHQEPAKSEPTKVKPTAPKSKGAA
jgi:F-type H+-transporting ATPase subunit beta